jgi:type IV secretory pathway VirB3-like protein
MNNIYYIYIYICIYLLYVMFGFTSQVYTCIKLNATSLLYIKCFQYMTTNYQFLYDLNTSDPTHAALNTPRFLCLLPPRSHLSCMLAARRMATVTLARNHPITRLVAVPLFSAIRLAASERINFVSLWMAPLEAAIRGTKLTRPAWVIC